MGLAFQSTPVFLHRRKSSVMLADAHVPGEYAYFVMRAVKQNWVHRIVLEHFNREMRGGH